MKKFVNAKVAAAAVLGVMLFGAGIVAGMMISRRTCSTSNWVLCSAARVRHPT